MRRRVMSALGQWYITNGLIAMWDCLLDNGKSTWTDAVKGRVITFTGLSVTKSGITFSGMSSSVYGTLGQTDTDATFGIVAAGGCMELLINNTKGETYEGKYARTLIKSSTDVGFSINRAVDQYIEKTGETIKAEDGGFGFRNTDGNHTGVPCDFGRISNYAINFSSDGNSDVTYLNKTELTPYADYIGGTLPTGTLFGKRVDNTRMYAGTWYALRLYSRNLTDAERAHNYAIDKARFGLS